MFELEKYLNVLSCGLQGSYLRNEADGDIDYAFDLLFKWCQNAIITIK
jgi:hypothetical protein